MKSTLATCFLLSLAVADASHGNGNDGGNRNGAPFMIMSEITVESSPNEGIVGDSKDAAANAEISRDDGDDAAALPSDDSTGANDAVNTERASSSEETHSDSGSGSDTDEEEDEGVVSSSTSSSPPLRTLQRLQAMLDDSDYASAPIQEASLHSDEGRHHIDEASASSQDKLWTSKDRVKYRRTRRTEKQRRQQREFEEHQARKARDMQRLMIIQEEREREEARRKEESLRNIQERQRRQQFVSRDPESSELTDDDTDTDALEFELTNNPVYFSDGEQSDDFSEEDEHSHLPPQRSPEYGQHQNQMPNHMNHMNQYGGGSYQLPSPSSATGFNQFSLPQQRFGPDQHPHMPNMPQNYQQYPPQQQNPQYSQFSDLHQQQIMQDARQYSQQYAAWAQAAANGYHYPPPQPPTTPEQPYNTNQNLQVPPHQHHPASSFDPRYYRVPQQQQNYYRKMYSVNHHQQRQNIDTQQRNTATNRAQENRQQAEAEAQGVKATSGAGMRRETLADNAPSKTAATSSMHGPMGVRSAVVPPTSPLISSPTSPLISSSPPRTSSLTKSPEGPYCELVDESVSLDNIAYFVGFSALNILAGCGH